MNITIQKVLDTASKHILVNETGEGDIYEYLNSGEHKYPCVFLTVTKVTDNEYNRTLGGTLFYVDRLVSDQSNKTAVQSTAVSVLRDILQAVDNEQESVEYMTFTEKFTDLCAGAYADCQISVSFTDACTDNFELITKDITENGVYEITGYDRAIVSVETPIQSKELSISANGSYTVLPDEGYYLDELKLDVDVTPDLDFKYVTDIKLNITDNIALPEVYYSMFNNVLSIGIRGNVNSIQFKEGNLAQVINMSSAFANCSSLTSITFPEGVLNQVVNMYYTFAGCSSLTSITFPEGALTLVTNMGTAFYYCSSLSLITFPEGALTLVKSMYDVFNSCSSLTSITFPNGALNQVTDMLYSFKYCRSLTSITFGEGALRLVTNMYSVFYYCSSLSSIAFPEGALTQTKTISHIFFGCPSLTSVIFTEGALTLVTNINMAFFQCKSLQDLTLYNLPNINLTNPGFSYCTRLTLQSLQNIINALPVTTSGYKCTIGTTNLNKLSAADIQIATDKGWTLN